MSVLSKEIAKYLDTNGAGAYKPNDVGGDIYYGGKPSSPNNCIAVFDTGGFNPKKDTTSDPTVMIQVRNEDYSTGMNKLHEIHDLLKDKNNFWLGDYIFVYVSEALGEPGQIGKDENGRHLFSCNYHLRVKYY